MVNQGQISFPSFITSLKPSTPYADQYKNHLFNYQKTQRPTSYVFNHVHKVGVSSFSRSISTWITLSWHCNWVSCVRITLHCK